MISQQWKRDACTGDNDLRVSTLTLGQNRVADLHDLIAPSPGIPRRTIRSFFNVDHSLAGTTHTHTHTVVLETLVCITSNSPGEFPLIIASRSNGSTQNHGGNPFLHDDYGVTATWRGSNVADRNEWNASWNDGIGPDRADNSRDVNITQQKNANKLIAVTESGLPRWNTSKCLEPTCWRQLEGNVDTLRTEYRKHSWRGREID